MFPGPQDSARADGELRRILRDLDLTIREAIIHARLAGSDDPTIASKFDETSVTLLLTIAADLAQNGPAGASADVQQAFEQVAAEAFRWAQGKMASPPEKA